MAYIPRQIKTNKEPFTVRLDRSVIQELDRYCRFLESSRDYVIGQALEIAFQKDREYAAWVRANESQEKGSDAGSKTPGGRRLATKEERPLESALPAGSGM